MEHLSSDTAKSDAKIIDLVLREHAQSLSPREWAHRIAGYGYSIKKTEHGAMIADLRCGQEICALPPHISV